MPLRYLLLLSFVFVCPAQQLPIPAGPLELQLTTGETLAIGGLSDNVVGVLLVRPTVCDNCDTGAQTLGVIHNELRDQGLEVLAAAVDTTGGNPEAFAADTAAFAQRVGVGYPVGVVTADQADVFLGSEGTFGGRTATALPFLVVLGPGSIIWEEHSFTAGGRGRGGRSNDPSYWTDAETNMRASFQERLARSGNPTLFAGGLVNAASFVGLGQAGHESAVGSIVSIFGARFAGGLQLAESSPLPTEIGGVSVMLGDTSVPLFFVSPGQINAQIPFGDAGGGRGRAGELDTVIIKTPSGDSNPIEIRPATLSPAIFTFDQTGRGQGIVVFANTSTLVAPRGVTADSRPARPGDALTVFANGLGDVMPPIEAGRNSCDPQGQCAADFSNLVLRHTVSAPAIRIGGLAGVRVSVDDIIFAGLAPQFVGLYQINFVLPDGVETGDAVGIGFVHTRLQQRTESPVTIAIENGS